MFSGSTTTTVSAPARGPLDYNALRPSFSQLAPLFGLTLLALLPVGLGSLLIYWSWPSDGTPGGLQAIGLGIGALLMFAGIKLFWPLSTIIPDAIRQWYAMAYQWHNAEIDKYEQSSGQVVAQQISEWTYTEHDMRHVMLAFAWLIIAQPKDLSIEKLTRGPLQVTLGGHRAYKVIDFTQDGAASFLNMLARTGILVGRGPRKAGTLAMMDPRQVGVKMLTEAAKNPATVVQSEGN